MTTPLEIARAALDAAYDTYLAAIPTLNAAYAAFATNPSAGTAAARDAAIATTAATQDAYDDAYNALAALEG